MAGYSGTPLPKKLGIKEGSRYALSGAPMGFGAVLGDIPVDASLREIGEGELDVLVFFTSHRAELEKRFADLANALASRGGR